MALAELRRVSTLVNVICFVTVLTAATCMNLMPLRAVERGFFCDDTSVRYPFHPETISNNVVLFSSFFPAWLLVVALEMTYGYVTSRRKTREYSTSDDSGRWEFMKSGLGCAAILTIALIYGNALAYIFTEIMKAAFGTLRPAFLAVCQPETDVTSLGNCTGWYIEKIVCTNPNRKLVLEMRRSFVSGHASFSSFNMFFIILYLQHRLPTSTPWLLKSLLQMLAMVFTVFVSATRIYDNYHHAWDIVAGLLTGLVFALLTVYKICPRFSRHPPRQEAETLPTLITSKPPAASQASNNHCGSPANHSSNHYPPDFTDSKE